VISGIDGESNLHAIFGAQTGAAAVEKERRGT
jgi:hypothetical protein